MFLPMGFAPHRMTTSVIIIKRYRKDRIGLSCKYVAVRPMFSKSLN